MSNDAHDQRRYEDGDDASPAEETAAPEGSGKEFAEGVAHLRSEPGPEGHDAGKGFAEGQAHIEADDDE